MDDLRKLTEIRELLVRLQRELLEQQFTVATAESCTGGLLAYLLTELPGSSQVYQGGVASYSNDVKQRVLGVPSSLLDSVGAVSSEVAEVMAQKARELCQANIGVSLTGIAGPAGATADKPVGTVWLGLAFGEVSQSRLLKLSGNRDEIRWQAAHDALKAINDILINL